MSAPDALDREVALSDLDFARLIERLGPFEARPRLAVAVSGGPDSLALTLLAERWARARGGSLVGLTVDHGLRPESEQEACTVGTWLRARGIRHAVLAWTGPKPDSGLQAAARDARYRLLGTFCRQERILHLLVAHQREDQAETVALRAARGSGPVGLAGMPAISERRGFRLLRPLLGVPKRRLAATLRRLDQPWIEDPWNSSPAFARGRLRAATPGPTAPPAPWAAWRARQDRTLAAWLARHARPHPLGFVDLEREALQTAEPDVALEVLKRVLLTVSGHRYPPRTAALERLHLRLRHGGFGTLGGVLVRPAGARLRFVREAAAIRPSSLTLAGDVWFDHRFSITCRQPRPDLTVGALGERGWLERRRLNQVGPPAPVDRVVGESLPVLLCGGVLVAVPQLGLVGPGAPPGGEVSLRWHPRHALAGPPHAPLPRGRTSSTP